MPLEIILIVLDFMKPHGLGPDKMCGMMLASHILNTRATVFTAVVNLQCVVGSMPVVHPKEDVRKMFIPMRSIQKMSTGATADS